MQGILSANVFYVALLHILQIAVHFNHPLFGCLQNFHHDLCFWKAIQHSAL